MEENLKYPEIIAAFKESLEKIKFQDIEVWCSSCPDSIFTWSHLVRRQVDSQFGELDKLVAEYSAQVRAQNEQFAAKLPQLKKDMARTQYLKENLSSLTIEEERQKEPAIFAEIDKELDEYQWDDEPVDAAAAHDKH